MLCVLAVFFTYKDYGISLDEPFYAKLGGYNVEWILNPSISTIDKYWPIDDRHPPFWKIVGGFSSKLFFEWFPLTDKYTAFRLATLPFVFMLSFAMAFIVSVNYGISIGIFAGLTSVFLPRIFFETHLGAIDFSITSLWFVSIVTTVLGTKKWQWRILSLILTGLSIGTKIQGVFLYMVIVLFWIVESLPKMIQKGVIFNRANGRWFMGIIWAIFIPPIVFIAIWPWMWPNIIWRFGYYRYLMESHYPVQVYYLFKSYINNPNTLAPWHYPFVLSLSTVPLIVLVFFFIGGLASLCSKKRYERFFLFNVFVPLCMMTLPLALKYDGVRLFLPAFPFIVFVAALGIYQVTKLIPKYSQIISIVLSSIVSLNVIFATYQIHPFQMSYFNELVGGTNGAKQRGFEIEYWATSYMNVTPFIREHNTDTYCAHPFQTSFETIYKEKNMIPSNIQFVSENLSMEQRLERCTYLILLSRQGFVILEPLLWDIYTQNTPVFTVEAQGAALVNVYKLH